MIDSYQKSLDRWYPLRDHPVQFSLVNDDIRVKVVPAGRRSGKTERAKRYVVREAMRTVGNYFVAAPTRDQVKRIYWKDLKLLSFSDMFPDRPSETELIIKFPNSSIISLIGLDQPQRIEGVIWDGGIVDEIADCKPNAWPENIAPALDTFNPLRPNYRPWCWLIGVPDGLGHYSDLADYADSGQDPSWRKYTWFSSDILPPDVIESAKNRMSARQYQTEYEAQFLNSTGRIYDDYGPANYTNESIQPHEILLWFHDFNFSPMSSGIGVKRGDSFYILDEIILQSAIAEQSALEFVEKYKNHQNKTVCIYGDPAGKIGEKHGHASDFTVIEAVLRREGWIFTRKVRNSTRSIKDGQNAVRAKIASATGEVSLFVNQIAAPYCHKALLTGKLKKGSTFIEDDSEFQHVGTAIRYLIEFECPIIPYKEPLGPIINNPTQFKKW